MGMQDRAHPRYRINHCEKQAAYCQTKLDLLRDYSNMSQVQIADNLGWGTSVARFSTLQSPIFEFLRSLCYRPDPDRPGFYLKTVTQEWVDQLNWRRVAWWYQDDGCKQARAMTFATHSFSKEEVGRLALWLSNNGVTGAAAKRTRKRESYYWILWIPSEGAATLADNIRPFMHPSMLYKLPDGKVDCPCLICGSPVPATFCGGRAQLCSDKCRTQRARMRWETRAAKMTSEERAEKSARQMTKIKSDPIRYAEWRAYHATKQAEKFAVPEKIVAHKEWKKSYRAKRKQEGRPEKPNQTHTCCYCQTPFSNSGTHKMGKRSPVIYCPAPACVELGKDAYKEIRRQTAREKWATKA